MSVTATIEMQSGGKMVFELYPQKAPISVANFCALAADGFYNGLTFHRVVRDYVIQGGSQDNTCMCPSMFFLTGEFSENGICTELDHRRGALSMARDDEFNTAGTQFFVVHKDAHKLDGRYAAFGLLTQGFDVLDEIASVPTKPQEEENRPLTPQVIARVVIEADEELPPVLRLPVE